MVWDKNGDSYVEMEEFFFVMYFSILEEDLVVIFYVIDIDGKLLIIINNL